MSEPAFRVRRALLATSDKSGLVELARGLDEAGVELLSTGGTARTLEEAELPVRRVEDLTGFPELFGGRVKTLHPRVHGGILLRRDRAEDLDEAERHGIGPIDLVVVNLYPFEQTVSREDVTFSEAVEQVDIGGPAMIRAAAKNHAHVGVIVEPADYGKVLDEIRQAGGLSEGTARELARKAFARTAEYDAAVAAWLDAEVRGENAEPDAFTLRGLRQQELRYGENPHQAATAYVVTGEDGGIPSARLHQGKELSYNNIADLDAAWILARDLEQPGCAIIKHANPCGAAEGPTLKEALQAARACDPISAFGGIYAFTSIVDAQTAGLLVEAFVECVIAPGYDDEALAVLAKRKNVRVLSAELPPERRAGRDWKRITGGFLVQDWDDSVDEPDSWEVVSRRPPTAAERQALSFAWRVVRHVKSNAIVFTAENRTLGIGAGQMSRVDSVELAVSKARRSELPLEGSAVASDAFFPFRDGVDAAAAAGATALVQPGGSKRDGEVIAAADEHDMALVFTGRRHFKH